MSILVTVVILVMGSQAIFLQHHANVGEFSVRVYRD